MLKPLDQSELKRLMEMLHASAGRDIPFLQAFIEVQAKLVGGYSGVIFSLSDGKAPRVSSAYPVRDGRASITNERMRLFNDCALKCRDMGAVSFFRVGVGTETANAICLPLIRNGRIEGVGVVLAPSMDEATLSSRIESLLLLAQSYPGHVAKRMLTNRTRQNAETRVALEVLAASHNADHFEACCMAVCNRLKSELGASRVSLGWSPQGAQLELIATSDTENIDRRQEINSRLEGALEECFDQAQAVVAPSDHLRGADQWLAQSVSRQHAELVSDGKYAVCSVPLRHQDGVYGALTVEQPVTSRFDGTAAAHLQAIADLVTPRLHDRYLDERPLYQKNWESARWVLSKITGPQHVGWKLVALISMGVLLYSVLATWDYRVDAPFTLEPGARHVYAAPFPGYLATVNVLPGDKVKAGALLGKLDDSELSLQIAELESNIREAQSRIDKAKAPGTHDEAEARRAEAQKRQYQARLDLAKYQQERASLVAAEDGDVLTGEWKDKLGVRVNLGDTIFEVAPITEIRAVLLVDEADIDRVRVGGKGELATRTEPTDHYPFEVTRIVPAGESYDGKQVFQVYAKINVPPDAAGKKLSLDWMRPGMQGTAKINAGDASPAWILTHRLVNYLRLKLWLL